MPWFWGSKDDEYESDEYTDGEYSDEEYEEYTDEEGEEEEGGGGEEAVVQGDEAVDAEAKEEEDGDDEKKEMETAIAVKKEGGGETNEPKKEEDGEESYVEVTKEDASSPKGAQDNDNKTPPQEDAEPKDMRDKSLLDTSADSAEEEEVSSIVEGNHDDVTDQDTTPDKVPSSITTDGDWDQKPVVKVETVGSEEESDSSESEEEEEELTSFADKQSMLLLAAEHDRVDILRAILTDDEDTDLDKNALMNTGIPPLHVAISFGSTNTTQSLLRMGADPSIRPNLTEVQKHYEGHQSKVEIKNMGRFGGISAWELAFGNEAYAKLEASGATKRSSWVFGSAIQPTDDESGNKIICPLDNIPDSKREGIRHAFTAEALRCLGGDELERLQQLVNSGMPATTEIAEKDLYQWAVEMGALKCEEYLRPIEAAKHANDEADNETGTKSSISNARVLDRSKPGDERSCSQLRNKLVELDSLAAALSTCVDNLAEEVSVCHGLLLMNGGASALASHVKSLKQQKADKEDDLSSAYIELEALEERLARMVQAAGAVGKEVLALSESELKQQQDNRKSAEAKNDDEDGSEDSETERQELLEKIEASETKIRKLRVSITDLSEESARDLKEVERRGLSGGIDLVRGLRDEIRDVEFQLAEANASIETCQAKMRLIRAKVSPETELPASPPAQKPVSAALDTGLEPFETEEDGDYEEGGAAPKAASQKIATGDSQAIAVRAPGKQGFFRIDLWQVILRIIGMNRAADRRALEVAQRQRQEQKKLGVDKRPEPVHVMTV